MIHPEQLADLVHFNGNASNIVYELLCNLLASFQDLHATSQDSQQVFHLERSPTSNVTVEAYLHSMCLWTPSLQSFDLIGRLLRSDFKLGYSLTSVDHSPSSNLLHGTIGSLIENRVLLRFVANSIVKIYAWEVDEQNGVIIDDRCSRTVQLVG